MDRRKSYQQLIHKMWISCYKPGNSITIVFPLFLTVRNPLYPQTRYPQYSHYSRLEGFIMEQFDLTTLWMGMLTELKQSLPPQIYDNWFESALIPYSYENNELTLDTASKFVCAYISKRYTSLLETIAQNVTGLPTRVTLINSVENTPQEPPSAIYETQSLPEPAAHNQEWVQQELPSMEIETVKKKPDTALPEIREAASIISPAPDTRLENNLIQNYTFETFIVGNSNRIAHAASLAIAEAPAKKYNPFYIYGGSGLGKTHLMHAIGHRILHNFPQMRLRCITSEDFVNEFIQCIQDKSTESFRQRYRNIDILLVDDIQFLGRGDKESSKEEFFHTFNKLYQDQKQMVFTSDRPPQDIKRLEDRLRSRFQSGMVTSIDPPDLETRTAILKIWAQKENVSIENNAIDYIASNVSENIRDLNGAFISVLLLASAEKSPITLNLTQRAIKYITDEKDEKKYITIDEITKSVCEFYNVNYKELMGKKKTKDIALPRQIAMYLCRELTGNTYPHIGTAFNGRDHTTVMHACTKVMKTMEKDIRFKESIEKLKIKITGVDS